MELILSLYLIVKRHNGFMTDNVLSVAIQSAHKTRMFAVIKTFSQKFTLQGEEAVLATQTN